MWVTAISVDVEVRKIAAANIDTNPTFLLSDPLTDSASYLTSSSISLLSETQDYVVVNPERAFKQRIREFW